MTTKLAKVYFYKDIEKDHYTKGCTGQLASMHTDSLTFYFETEQDLIKQFAAWIEARFDISINEYLEHVHNECDHYRFDFSQNEDGQGYHQNLSKDNPEGFLARYQMLVTEVMEIKQIDYQFELKN